MIKFPELSLAISPAFVGSITVHAAGIEWRVMLETLSGKQYVLSHHEFEQDNYDSMMSARKAATDEAERITWIFHQRLDK